MASSIYPLVNGDTTSSLLSGGIVPTATTSGIASTGIGIVVIGGKEGEREFKPDRVSTTLGLSSTGTTAVIGINSYQNLEYQRALYQKKQADNVRDIDEKLAARSPEEVDKLLAMIDTREQELAFLEEQEEKVHVKHL